MYVCIFFLYYLHDVNHSYIYIVYLHSSIIIWVKGTLGKGWGLSGLEYEKNVSEISRGVKNKTMYSNNSQIYKKIKIRRIWRAVWGAASNADGVRKQLEWMRESRKAVMQGCDELSRENRIIHYHVIKKTWEEVFFTFSRNHFITF